MKQRTPKQDENHRNAHDVLALTITIAVATIAGIVAAHLTETILEILSIAQHPLMQPVPVATAFTITVVIIMNIVQHTQKLVSNILATHEDDDKPQPKPP